jgi:hypothetical protein
MPGIYTHNYIFRKAADSALKSSGKSYLMKSVALLLSSPEHKKAGLLGAIGPNIFDYIHPLKKSETYGHHISFYLHDSGYSSFIDRMLDLILESGDMRNEWTSVRRAYLFGYISHIISDSIVHPYVFYSSGFPENDNQVKSRFFRRSNLRFQYNIDNWFIYRDGTYTPAELDVSTMIPSMKITSEKGIWLPVRSLLLESLKRENNEMFSSEFRKIENLRLDGSLAKNSSIDRC